MKREELSALVDRVIGSKGIMRTPAWWVRYLFNKLVEYVDSAIKSVKIKSDTEMSDESENPVQNKVIKAYVDSSHDTRVVRMAAKSSCELQPNIYYYWGNNTVTNAMSITLLDYVEDYTGGAKLKTYTLDIKAGADCSLSFNVDLQWNGGSMPSFKEGQRYQINIKGRYASVVSSDENPLHNELLTNEEVIAAALNGFDTRIRELEQIVKSM